MTTLIVLYKGPPKPPDASHAGWPEWFERIEDRLVDQGSPMANGFVVDSDGTTSETATNLNGYSLVRADDRQEALRLLEDHPFLAAGRDHTIEVFEVPSK